MRSDSLKKMAVSILGLVFFMSGCSQSESTEAPAEQLAKTTITALVWAPDWSEEMRQIAYEFTKEHPQIDVDIQLMIGNSVEENIKPRIASDKLPDIISINPNTYAAALADQGVLADVSHSAAWSNMLDSLKADWTSPGNKHFGLAGGVAAPLIYYNKDMFRRAGITRLPENFDEFLLICEQLKKAGFTPIMWNGGFPNVLGNGPFSTGFANNVVANDANWQLKLNDGSLDLNTSAVADIFFKIKLIADRGYVQKKYMHTGYDDGIRLFVDGKTAMSFHGTWASGLLMKGKGFKTGIFTPPWNAAGEKVVPVIGSETGFAVCETPNKKAAFLFFDYLYGKGFQIQQNKRQNISPLKKMQGQEVGDQQVIDYVNVISHAPVTGSPYYAFLPASTIEMLHPLLQNVLFGNVSPQQAAKMLDASVKNEARRKL